MTESNAHPLLDKIDLPSDLRQLPADDLVELSNELRDFLISSVSKSGGHLAAGLGTIELTVALHYVFDTPNDKLIWDVGHQAYPHKILTGRKTAFQPFDKKTVSRLLLLALKVNTMPLASAIQVRQSVRP